MSKIVRKDIEKIINKNVKKVPFEGNEINIASICDSIIELIEKSEETFDPNVTTLITDPNDQPVWVELEDGLSHYKEFRLGQNVQYDKYWVKIIHIQKVHGEVIFRGLLDNGASITMNYNVLRDYLLESWQ